MPKTTGNFELILPLSSAVVPVFERVAAERKQATPSMVSELDVPAVATHNLREVTD